LYLGVLENEEVCLVVSDEELQVEVDGHVPTEDGEQLGESLLDNLLHPCLKNTTQPVCELVYNITQSFYVCHLVYIIT